MQEVSRQILQGPKLCLSPCIGPGIHNRPDESLHVDAPIAKIWTIADAEWHLWLHEQLLRKGAGRHMALPPAGEAADFWTPSN